MRMSELEQDKLESEKRVTQLQQSLETLKASQKHKEKLEVIIIQMDDSAELSVSRCPRQYCVR